VNLRELPEHGVNEIDGRSTNWQTGLRQHLLDSIDRRPADGQRRRQISMTNCAKTSPGGDGVHQYSKRAESQVTLSVIGDVSVAATDAIDRVAAAPLQTRWLPIYVFLLFTYVAGSLVAIYTYESEPWVQVFVAPLPLVLIAAVEFWRRQVWKFRAQDRRFKEQVQQDALNSLAHETATGLNAIRANLTALTESDCPANSAEHLEIVERSLGRIAAAVERAVGQTEPLPPPSVAEEAPTAVAA
jgi:signal transduction histidine kinase